ncbi:MAG: transglutaminase-like cysteine peptidase [Gammaproteobacteria bacterium]
MSASAARPLATASPLLCILLAGILSLAGIAPCNGEEFTLAVESLAGIRETYGEHALQRISDWQDMIRASNGLDDMQKLQRTNDFFNKVTFISDIDHWGKEDYWATPLQMLASNGGDCEDFSIAKYFTLRQMGIPAERMRLTYVKALELEQAHMVLTYYSTSDADPLVLDNLVMEIRTSSSRTDLLPVYSFNGNGLWLVKARGMDQHVGDPERLSRWKEVIARISDEQLALPR